MQNARLLICVSLLCWALTAQAKNGMPSANVAFMENTGQVTDQYHHIRNDIQFRVNASSGLNIFVGNGALHYQFNKPQNATANLNTDETTPRIADLSRTTSFTMYRMDVELIGANQHATVTTTEPQGYYERFYTQNTGMNGCTSRAYGRIVYHNVYPSIDWVLYTDNGGLKHEFVVRPGGNVADIQLKYSGTQQLRLTDGGGLMATTPQGAITEDPPYAYDATGKKVNSSFIVKGDVVTYETGSYSGTLVIDPSISWATYYGGSAHDNACAVSVDMVGYTYTSGNTYSVASIATTGAFLATVATPTDAFLVKFNVSGVRQWATYYGGSSGESGDAVVADVYGNVFMAGATSSPDGIATPGSYQTIQNGPQDGFLVKFDGTGARQWGTYYGGDSLDFVATNGIATDVVGNVMIAGYTKSLDSVATTGAWQTTIGGGVDGFVAKFNNYGTLKWGTYYGGTGTEMAMCVAADPNGNVFITGYTGSATGIASTGSFLSTPAGSTDAYLAKFDSIGVRQWGTYYGGADYEMGEAVCTDLAGNVYISGRTTSTTGIATALAFQTTKDASADAYLVKFTPGGSRLWGTYYGGSSGDYGNCLATDASNMVYLSGFTGSTTGLATAGAYQTSCGGGNDAFLVQFSSSGGRFWATYFGGVDNDQAFGITAGYSNYVYMAGLTANTTSVATPGAHQTTYGGANDAFLVSFSLSVLTEVAGVINNTATAYPVPANNLLNIQLASVAASNTTVTITDIAGRVVYTGTVKAGETSLRADISNIPSGIYLAKIVAEQEVQIIKIAVEK